jgi:hypothetical protein
VGGWSKDNSPGSIKGVELCGSLWVWALVGTKLETRVRIKDIGSGRTVFGFRTTGGSNINSGIITSYGPLTLATAGGALFDVVVSAGKGLTDDTHRTAKMIADYISQQLATSGAIPQSKAREPKILNGPVDALGSLRN